MLNIAAELYHSVCVDVFSGQKKAGKLNRIEKNQHPFVYLDICMKLGVANVNNVPYTG